MELNRINNLPDEIDAKSGKDSDHVTHRHLVMDSDKLTSTQYRGALQLLRLASMLCSSSGFNPFESNQLPCSL